MATAKVFLCLTSLIILAASPAYCAPQLWNFGGWPAQPESAIPRLPSKAFMPAESLANKPMSFLPNPFSLPAATALPQGNVAMAVQPRTLQTQDIVPESRLFSGPTTHVPKPQASKKIDEAEVTTTAVPVIDASTTTELNQPTATIKTPTTVLPKKVLTTTPPSVTAAGPVTDMFSQQNMMEFIPAGVAALGAALGRDGCALKAACLAGRLIPASLQGQGLMLLAAESLVPAQWKEHFRAVKSSIIDRNTQDCSSFSCF